jgi:hypothetical protein
MLKRFSLDIHISVDPCVMILSNIHHDIVWDKLVLYDDKDLDLRVKNVGKMCHNQLLMYKAQEISYSDSHFCCNVSNAPCPDVETCIVIMKGFNFLAQDGSKLQVRQELFTC